MTEKQVLRKVGEQVKIKGDGDPVLPRVALPPILRDGEAHQASTASKGAVREEEPVTSEQVRETVTEELANQVPSPLRTVSAAPSLVKEFGIFTVESIAVGVAMGLGIGTAIVGAHAIFSGAMLLVEGGVGNVLSTLAAGDTLTFTTLNPIVIGVGVGAMMGIAGLGISLLNYFLDGERPFGKEEKTKPGGLAGSA